jgi:hypothetical protein
VTQPQQQQQQNKTEQVVWHYLCEKGLRKKVLWALVFNEGFCINKLTFYAPVMTKSSRRDEFMLLYGYLCMLS